MNRKYLMMAAVAAALAGPMAAHAQQADQSAPQQPAPQQAAPMPNSQTAPAATPATQDAAPASATVPADTTSPAAPTTADASGNQVVSNGPVADTPANRAKYGKPMSMAGRMTKPAGN